MSAGIISLQQRAARVSRKAASAANYGLGRSESARFDMTRTPVRSVVAASGANRLECRLGRGGPPLRSLRFIAPGETAPSRNSSPGIFSCLEYRAKSSPPIPGLISLTDPLPSRVVEYPLVFMHN